jgi:hypothetical protein
LALLTFSKWRQITNVFLFPEEISGWIEMLCRNCTPYGVCVCVPSHRCAFTHRRPAVWLDLFFTRRRERGRRVHWPDLVVGDERKHFLFSIFGFASPASLLYYLIPSFSYFLAPLGDWVLFQMLTLPFFSWRSFLVRGGGGSWSATGHSTTFKKIFFKRFKQEKNVFLFSPPPLQLPVSPFSTTALTIFVNNNFSIFAYPSYYAHIWFVSVRPQKTFKIQGGGEQKFWRKRIFLIKKSSHLWG